MHYGLYNGIWSLFLDHYSLVLVALHSQWVYLVHIYVISKGLQVALLQRTFMSTGIGTAKALYGHFLIHYRPVNSTQATYE
jgi:hypothetical protein